MTSYTLSIIILKLAKNLLAAPPVDQPLNGMFFFSSTIKTAVYVRVNLFVMKSTVETNHLLTYSSYLTLYLLI